MPNRNQFLESLLSFLSRWAIGYRRSDYFSNFPKTWRMCLLPTSPNPSREAQKTHWVWSVCLWRVGLFCIFEHKRDMAAWLVFPSSREKISQLGIEPPCWIYGIRGECYIRIQEILQMRASLWHHHESGNPPWLIRRRIQRGRETEI